MNCIIIGGIIVLVYLLFGIIKTKEIPKSISETFYTFASYGFTIMMFTVAILCIIGLLELTENNKWQFLSFFTGIGLALIGAAPNFKNNEYIVHMIGALLFIISSQIWVLILGNNVFIFLWVLIPSYIFTQYRTICIELTSILALILSAVFI